MILRSRLALPLCAPPIEDCALRIEGNRITAVGCAKDLPPRPGEQVEDLGASILLPGLINAHCHLDYSALRDAIAPPKSFTAWILQLNSIKRSFHEEEIVLSIGRGYREALQYGTTSIYSMAAFPQVLGLLPPPPLRTWWFLEMLDIRQDLPETVIEKALSFLGGEPHPLIRFGLNPHAPYTASLKLFHLAQKHASERGLPLTTHVAESTEETEMFQQSRGPLFDLLKEIGRNMEDCGHTPPFSWLWKKGAIGPGWLLAHLNELTEADFALLESLPREELPHVVHCPGSHRYFGHRAFPFQKLARLGANICIGTDSLASTQTLSLFAELRNLRESEPGMTPQQLLHTVTLAPARALGMQGELGCIAPGALADLIAVPYEGGAEQAAEALIDYSRFVPWLMVDGKIHEDQPH